MSEVALGVGALPTKANLLNVTLSEEVSPPGDLVDVMVSLKPPEGTERSPVDICCIVDVSDSMATEAVAHDNDGSEITHGLSILDIVKHALRTIINTLENRDRLAIVSYANSAKVVLEITAMDAGGRAKADQSLGGLRTDGMTNLWAGLNMGIELLRSASQPDKIQHVMLLTDGVPNLNPPRGIIPMLKRMRDKSGVPCTLNTYGFGYDLDSKLLSEIAALGGGTYAFIPDAGFVGTVFVNAMANFLVTMARKATVTLEPENGASVFSTSVPCGFPCSSGAGGRLTVDVGTLQFGQSRDILVRMQVPQSARAGSWVNATLQYEMGGASKSAQAKGAMQCEDQIVFELSRLRCTFVDGIRRAMLVSELTGLERMHNKEMPLSRGQEKITAVVETAQQTIAGTPLAEREEVEWLLEDMTGQVVAAFSREDWYKKWGVHYLPSLTCAHSVQQCNNFKDPGVQSYGGDLFERMRDEADDQFLKLPAPQPSIPPPQVQAPSAAAPVRTQVPTLDMSYYHSASAA